MQTIPHQNNPLNVAQLAHMVNCLSEDDLATLAGVQRSTLAAWRKRGQGPEYILLGCNYLYPIPSIQSHLKTLVRSRTIIDAKTILVN